MSLLVEVASFINRPRNVPESLAEDFYREGEALAFGIDVALRARGVRRTDFIQQRPNRRAFAEALELPGGWRGFEERLLALEGVAMPAGSGEDGPGAAIAAGRIPTRFPHLLGHAAPPWYYVPRDFALPIWIPRPRAQLHPGAAPAGERMVSLGSVARVRDELQLLDSLLQERGYDAAEWFPAGLLEAVDVSLETGLPVIVSEQRLETSHDGP